MTKRLLLAAALAAAIATGAAAPGRADGGVEIGRLNCTIAGGKSFIFGSTKELACTFKPLLGGAKQRYRGTIKRFGLDVGKTVKGVLTWGVAAVTKDVGPGFLAGDYMGVSAQADAGVGVGANILVGGSERGFTLRPYALQAEQGVGLAAGVAQLTLEALPN